MWVRNTKALVAAQIRLERAHVRQACSCIRRSLSGVSQRLHTSIFLLLACVTGGLAAARRGLFYGVWLGGMFGLFRNHIASLRDQAALAEEDAVLAQVRGRDEGRRGGGAGGWGTRHNEGFDNKSRKLSPVPCGLQCVLQLVAIV